MIPSIRHRFNDQFTEEKYKKYLAEINSHSTHPVEFRIAETPLFIPLNFKNALLSAGDEIISTLLDASTIHQTQKAIPKEAL